MKHRFCKIALLTEMVAVCCLALADSRVPASPNATTVEERFAPGGRSAPEGKPAPAFTLSDTHQRRHSLTEFRGRSVALFFFCGCDPCRRCASLWAEAQQSGVLESKPPPKTITIAVFMGEAASANAFAAETGLDMKRTLLLIDPQEKAANAYGVTDCPRFFILDSHGRLRCTNKGPGTNPQTTPTTVIVSRAQTALQLLDKPAPQKAVLHVSEY